MNNDRRRRIALLIDQLEQASSTITELCEEEQEAFDNMPEPIQMGGRGDAAQEAIDSLLTAGDSIRDCIDALMAAAE